MPSTNLVTKLDHIGSLLEGETINRHDEIDAIKVALITRTHMFMLSPPGNAKTFLVDRMRARISGANVFIIELSKYIDDEDVIGPKSIAAFRDDRDERRTAGYLPEAHLAFMDEIWNGNSALLQSLHGITHERRLKVGDHTIDVPLASLLCASNKMPDAQHDECAAIYDRILQRLIVDAPVDPNDLRRLLLLRIDPDPQPVITWDEVVTAQQEAAALPISSDAVEAIIEITVKLRSQDITFSPRRFRQAQFLAQGPAWLAGDSEVLPEHLEILRNVLWTTPAQRSTVEKTVMEVCSPTSKAIIAVADVVAKQSEEFDKGLKLDEADPARGAVFLEVRKKIERAMGDAIALEDRATGRAAARLADTMRRMDGLHAEIALEVAGVTGTKSLADSVRSRK